LTLLIWSNIGIRFCLLEDVKWWIYQNGIGIRVKETEELTWLFGSEFSTAFEYFFKNVLIFFKKYFLIMLIWKINRRSNLNMGNWAVLHRPLLYSPICIIWSRLIKTLFNLFNIVWTLCLIKLSLSSWIDQ
jgi:hypothetical protein